jgi:hypothetical protein
VSKEIVGDEAEPQEIAMIKVSRRRAAETILDWTIRIFGRRPYQRSRQHPVLTGHVSDVLPLHAAIRIARGGHLPIPQGAAS